MEAKARRKERVAVRMTAEAKRILQQGAAVKHKTLAKFLIDSGINAAYAAITEQRPFVLNEKQWNELMNRLDAPPEPNEGLRRLMSRKPRWKL